MNQNLKTRILPLLGLTLVVVFVVFGWTAPAQADGGGWPTSTPTITQTNIAPTASPIDLLFTPVPDAGSPSVSFEDELATIQVEIQQTSAAQNIFVTPTAVPGTEIGSMTPLLMVLGLVVSMAVLAFLAFRLLRR